MSSKPKYTEERAEVILNAIEAGNWIVTAARRAGVSARTVRNWVKQGEEKPSQYPDLKSFADRYRTIIAEAEAQLVECIANSARSDARHAEWLLEKRFPKRWGGENKSKIELSGPGGGSIKTQVIRPLEGMSDAELVEIGEQARLALESARQQAVSSDGGGMEGSASVPATSSDDPTGKVPRPNVS